MSTTKRRKRRGKTTDATRTKKAKRKSKSLASSRKLLMKRFGWD